VSIQNYVPYNLWSPADPRKVAVQQAGLSPYRHDLLVPMLKGIPVYQQHGGNDDNVPTYHSKLMHQLIAQSGWYSRYSEVVDHGHWWDGVMTTSGLAKFFSQKLSGPSHKLDEIDSFEVVTAHPITTSPKYGVRILYLVDPGQLGRLKVSRVRPDEDIWLFEPENVLVFEIDSSFGININNTKLQDGMMVAAPTIMDFVEGVTTIMVKPTQYDLSTSQVKQNGMNGSKLSNSKALGCKTDNSPD
jgi:hypothetical protein